MLGVLDDVLQVGRWRGRIAGATQKTFDCAYVGEDEVVRESAHVLKLVGRKSKQTSQTKLPFLLPGDAGNFGVDPYASNIAERNPETKARRSSVADEKNTYTYIIYIDGA